MAHFPTLLAQYGSQKLKEKSVCMTETHFITSCSSFLFLQAIEGFIFNQNANKTVSTEINTYRKRIKTVTILRMWWTLFWLYIQYFDIQVQTKVTLFSCRILWSKLPVISMCWDLLGKLYLYSRNPWYGFSFVKSTKIMYRGKSHYLRECEVS